MTAKALREVLRTIGIFNPFDFCTAHGPLNLTYTNDRPAPPVVEGIPNPVPRLSYRPQQNGRGYHPWAWQVVRSGKQTDPGAHWRDNGNKTFNGFYHHGTSAEQKKQALAAARAWAAVRYAYDGEWTKDPWGDYMPTPFYEARLEQLLAHAAEVTA